MFKPVILHQRTAVRTATLPHFAVPHLQIISTSACCEVGVSAALAVRLQSCEKSSCCAGTVFPDASKVRTVFLRGGGGVVVRRVRRFGSPGKKKAKLFSLLSRVLRSTDQSLTPASYKFVTTFFSKLLIGWASILDPSIREAGGSIRKH